MQLTIKGLQVIVDERQIERMVLDRFNEVDGEFASEIHEPPAIGEIWTGQGGIYGGVARGENGAPDYYLIAGPEHDDDIAWQPAMDWARTVKVDGLADFTLPLPREQSILYGNLPELFKARAYWSSKEYASASNGAWYQYFLNGGQGYYHKASLIRARVLRRLPIH